jgi:pilus assembly protein CpaB
MPMRNIATLAIAIFLGLLSVVLVRSYLSTGARSDGTPAVAMSTTPVVVAAQTVARGEVLQPASLKVVDFPRNSVPAGSFRGISQLSGSGTDQPVALHAIVANEPILSDEISGANGKHTLAISISDGMRAVSLRSNDVAGVGGFVLPGDRVDVMLTRAAANLPNDAITQVLAENVLVLGVDQSSNDAADTPVVARSVTVEVNPSQAQTISLGQTVGTLSLALRHTADGTLLTRRETSVADLGMTAPAKRSPQSELRVTRGVESTVYHVGGGSAP